MIGAIAGLATSIGSSIYGGIKAAKANREYKKQMAELERKQNDWYASRYNQDYTQRADVQALLSRASDEARKQIAAARGAQAVMGGTDESVAAAQAAANAGLADTYSTLAAQGSAYKDTVDQQNQKNISDNAQRMMNYYAQSAANSQQAASEGMKAGMGLVSIDALGQLNTGKDVFMNMFRRK